MKREELDFRILKLLAEGAREFSSKVAFVGDVNHSKENIESIHMLCSIDVILPSNTWLKDVVDERHDRYLIYSEKFGPFKKQVENFFFHKDLIEFHERFPEVKIIVEEVSKYRFPFRELELNAPKLYWEIINWYNVSDNETTDEQSLNHRHSNFSFGFDTERDLMHFFWGFPVPYSLPLRDLPYGYDDVESSPDLPK
jgi:hypothetical protein